jgi:glutamyl/glutaminyl-tRNA synthetase
MDTVRTAEFENLVKPIRSIEPVIRNPAFDAATKASTAVNSRSIKRIARERIKTTPIEEVNAVFEESKKANPSLNLYNLQVTKNNQPRLVPKVKLASLAKLSESYAPDATFRYKSETRLFYLKQILKSIDDTLDVDNPEQDFKKLKETWKYLASFIQSEVKQGKSVSTELYTQLQMLSLMDLSRRGDKLILVKRTKPREIN